MDIEPRKLIFLVTLPKELVAEANAGLPSNSIDCKQKNS